MIPQAANASIQSTPRMLLEILVYGIEEDRAVINEYMNLLQAQIIKYKQSDRVRIFWYIDKGEMTNEDKRQWLIDNSSCRYYVFGNADDDYYLPKEFVKDCTMAIKRLEASLAKVKELNIKPKSGNQQAPRIPPQNSDAVMQVIKN